MTKSRVFTLNGASQCRVTKEKNDIYNKIKLGFCVARSAWVRLSALGSSRLYGAHLSDVMALGQRLTWSLRSIATSWAQVQMCSIMSCLGSSTSVLNHSICALDRTDRDLLLLCLFSPLKPHFYVNDLQQTKTPKTTKKLENNKAKSLTNLS